MTKEEFLKQIKHHYQCCKDDKSYDEQHLIPLIESYHMHDPKLADLFVQYRKTLNVIIEYLEGKLC